MSQGQRYPLDEAKEKAQQLVDLLSVYCNRVEILGSIRRSKLDVGDIELLIEPTIYKEVVKVDLFTEQMMTITKVEEVINSYCTPRKNKHNRAIAWNQTGRFMAGVYQEIPVDFFIIRPDRLDWWGWHKLLRTGPGDANKLLVTSRQYGGMKPDNVVIRDGVVYVDNEPYPLRTEADVFKMFGVRYIPPEYRSVHWYKKVQAADITLNRQS